MLTAKIQSQLRIIGWFLLHFPSEEIRHAILNEEGASENPDDLIGVPGAPILLTDYAYEAICDNGNIDLDPHRIFRLPPKGSHSKMLLYPFEEQLNYPAPSIETCYLESRKIEVVCVVYKGTFEFARIIDDTPNGRGIVGRVSFRGKAHCLVGQHPILFIAVFDTALNKYLRMFLFSDDKETVLFVNRKESGQIPIASIENIARIGFIFNQIHSVYIVYLRICDMEHDRYHIHHIDLRMHFDATFGFAEHRPLIEPEAQVYSSGVKSIEIPSVREHVIVSNANDPSPFDHVVCKVLEYSVVSYIVCPRHRCQAGCLPKAKVLASGLMSRDHVVKFTKASATIELAKHNHEQMVPWRDCPAIELGVVLGCNAVELSLIEAICNLPEYISTCVHCGGDEYDHKGSHFKTRTMILTWIFVYFS